MKWTPNKQHVSYASLYFCLDDALFFLGGLSFAKRNDMT